MRTVDRALLAGAVALAAVLPARAQAQAAPRQPADSAARALQAAADPRLVFEREVFAYPGRARRDPFMPLTGQNAGPLFDDLKIHVIFYMDNPTESIVSLSDGTGKQHRLRRGDSVGNATVIDIGKTRVVFSVSDFGIRRQEVLELKTLREGAIVR